MTWPFFLALLAACGSEDSESPSDKDAGDVTSADGGTVDASNADGGRSDAGNSTADAAGPLTIDGNVGNFSVRLVAPVAANGSTPAVAGYVAVTGKVYDGLVPPDLLWATSSVVGDCTLLKPRAPYCENGCESGYKCVEDDTCQRYPTARDLGTLTLTGVATTTGSTPVPLTAIQGSYGASGSTKFAYPPFAEGAAVSLSAASGSPVSLSVAAKGVAPLVLTNTSYKLDGSKAFTLTWQKAGAASDARIRVRLDISHHGGARGLLTCDTADSGSLDIAASLVKGLLDLGIAGFPTVVVARESIGSADIGAGSVSLTVYSDLEHSVEIDGLVSCSSDNSVCPTGQTCQSDLTCK